MSFRGRRPRNLLLKADPSLALGRQVEAIGPENRFTNINQEDAMNEIRKVPQFNPDPGKTNRTNPNDPKPETSQTKPGSKAERSFTEHFQKAVEEALGGQ